MFRDIQLAPSLLAADFLNLERDVRLIGQARPEWLHVDVMDGHFVPNLTIGPPVVKALKQAQALPLDVHLMISNPAEQLDRFLDAGADLVTVHVESSGADCGGGGGLPLASPLSFRAQRSAVGESLDLRLVASRPKIPRQARNDSGVDGTVGSGADGTVGSGADGTVGSGADGTVGSGADGTVGSGADGTVGSGVDGTVGSGVDGTVGSGADGTVGSGADGTVGNARRTGAAGGGAPGTSPSVECVEDPDALVALIERIHAAGAAAGVALDPGTPAAVLGPFIGLVDLVLVMSVHPGFGGQRFIEATLDKLAQVVALARTARADPLLEVDGGIDVRTAPLVAAQGADVLVAGNAVFGADDPCAALRAIREAARQGQR